jgi:hypothetical protein
MSIRQRLEQLESQIDAQLSEEAESEVTMEEIQALVRMIEGEQPPTPLPEAAK